MKDLTPLTSRNGESEWPYENKTVIAVPDESFCKKCIFDKKTGCEWKGSGFKGDCTGFGVPAVFIYKPAKKR